MGAVEEACAEPWFTPWFLAGCGEKRNRFWHPEAMRIVALMKVRKIEGKVRERMTGVSWRPGCPVGLKRLRLIRTSFWNFDRKRDKGSIVVHEDEAEEIVRVFRSLYRQKFKIRRMELIERYDGSDHASMNADNT